MYNIIEVESLEKQHVILSNSDSSSMAKICLNEGGRLTDFTFNNTEIITNETPSNYKESFASAILFPFANRVKNGEYTFNTIHYKLDCNEKTRENAIHGLVYNKSFSFISKDLNSNNASATFVYKENEGSNGFPFKYSITLKYTLNDFGVFLEVTIKNEDDKPFPFTLGWHPYFSSSSLDKSELFFKSSEKLITNTSGIVIGKERLNIDKPIKVENKKFDDAYIMQSDTVKFKTPNYQLQLRSSASDKFLQIYTPNSSNTIAIEPLTGVSDSFNNNIGKKTLYPKDHFFIEWQIEITNFESHKSSLTH